ncbi:MAG: hypothetical protein KDH17_13110 [Rhodocyclaceae bacterium]|nr:hypothetical protein [Rhodocyclaceae bacterium]
MGIVTAIADDPAGEHRIRVKIPVAGFDEEGVWARLATLDAGNGRGTYFRPETDDEVVVGFFHDDPAYPVILGGLHSSAMPPPEDSEADNALKGFTSREGLQVVFDDEKKVMTLATPGGNKVVLSDDDGGIRLEDQNGNSIALSSEGVAIKSAAAVSVQAATDASLEGVNVNVNASASLTAEGSASASMSSSGQLEISGTLVMIN